MYGCCFCAVDYIVLGQNVHVLESGAEKLIINIWKGEVNRAGGSSNNNNNSNSNSNGVVAIAPGSSRVRDNEDFEFDYSAEDEWNGPPAATSSSVVASSSSSTRTNTASSKKTSTSGEFRHNNCFKIDEITL